MKYSSLDNFFYPKTICIPGASSKEKSIGYELLRSIKEYNYTGDVLPVNPKADCILGYKCYASITEITKVIDLAIVVVPKAFAEDTIDQLLSKNVKAIILITAGFKETGRDGEAAEQRIIKKIKDAGARIVGPNCMGIITTFNDIKLNATFVAEKPEIGKTAFLSQSGAIGAAVLNSLRETDIRFGHFISVGNKGDISENDLLSYWEQDNNIKTMTMYLESFSKGTEFISHFNSGSNSKPVIVLKAGRTSAGIKAASSHTGALGSSDKVVDAVLDQFGIIRADNLNELFNSAKGFEYFPQPKGSRIAVVTNAGGPAILCVDRIEKEGLQLASLDSETKSKLREFVHPEGSIENPVDLLPEGSAEQFKAVNELLLNDTNVDAVISIFVEPVMVDAFNVVEGINSIKSDKPLLQTVMPLPEFWMKYRKTSSYKKPLFRNPEDPAEVISNMLFFEKKKDKAQRLSGTRSLSFSQKGFIEIKEAEALLKKYNIPVIESKFVSPEELKISQNFNYPVCIKGISSKVIHKSEFDAVKLNIPDGEALLKAAGEITESFSKNNVMPDEFLVQPFIKGKYELLIGGFRDPSFGPMVMFGTGGKYVEVYEDTAIKSAYLNEYDIEEMIERTKAGRILKGVRGEKSADLEIIKAIIKNSAQLMLDNPGIEEFDLNPVIVTIDGAITAVDVRIKVSD